MSETRLRISLPYRLRNYGLEVKSMYRVGYISPPVGAGSGLLVRRFCTYRQLRMAPVGQTWLGAPEVLYLRQRRMASSDYSDRIHIQLQLAKRLMPRGTDQCRGDSPRTHAGEAYLGVPPRRLDANTCHVSRRPYSIFPKRPWVYLIDCGIH